MLDSEYNTISACKTIQDLLGFVFLELTRMLLEALNPRMFSK